MRAKKGFKEAGNLRKDELERAMEDIDGLKAKMRETYGNGNKDNNGKNGNQIRLMGTIDFVFEGISAVEELYNVKSVGVMKLEKDKKNRIGDFSATHLKHRREAGIMQVSKVLLLMTRGFQFGIPEPEQQKILKEGLERIDPKAPNFIVFDPKAERERTEDNEESLILPSATIDKVYVKLDDFGSNEALSENYGYSVNTQFAVTFLLAEEY